MSGLEHRSHKTYWVCEDFLWDHYAAPQFSAFHVSAQEWLSRESRAGKYFGLSANSQQAFLSLEDFYFKSYLKKNPSAQTVLRLDCFLTYNHIYKGQNVNTADSADIIWPQEKSYWFSYSAEPGTAFGPNLYSLPMILFYICVSLQGTGTQWDPTPSLLPNSLLNRHAKTCSFFLSWLVIYVPGILCPLLYFYNLSHIFLLIRLSEQHRALDSNCALRSSTW